MLFNLLILREMHSNLIKQLTQSVTDLSEEESQCRCTLIGTLEAGINIAAIQSCDLEIAGSKGDCCICGVFYT